jgi:sugar/nucleoside kinase (ribokinase family)
MPIYPDPRPPVERTGCGDAFASTFVGAMMLGKSPLEALTWAPVNPMSVVQYVGAQEGLLDRESIEWHLKNAPEDYRPREI